MFYSEEEMKIAEDMAWKMLDGWNHAYLPDLKDYTYFYYKNKLVMDPWMNEKSQNLTWPDHESPECAVDPVEYYGEETIINFVKNMVLLAPEWAPEMTEKTRNRCDENGLFKPIEEYSMPIEVSFAMFKDQAEEEHTRVCIGGEFPESKRVYFMLGQLPEELATVVQDYWEKEIIVAKKDIKKVMKLLYPDGLKWDYMKVVNRIRGKEVRIIGFGD